LPRGRQGDRADLAIHIHAIGRVAHQRRVSTPEIRPFGPGCAAHHYAQLRLRWVLRRWPWQPRDFTTNSNLVGSSTGFRRWLVNNTLVPAAAKGFFGPRVL